jgi:hypothetical protein
MVYVAVARRSAAVLSQYHLGQVIDNGASYQVCTAAGTLAVTLLRPTYWPHSGLWTLPDGRSAPTVRELDAQLDHRRERIADWRAPPSMIPAYDGHATRDQIRAYLIRRNAHRLKHGEVALAPMLPRIHTPPPPPPENTDNPSMKWIAENRKYRRTLSDEWTPEEDECMLDLLRRGHSRKEVSKMLHRSRNSIIGRAYRLAAT